jgi:hypothetical protein
MEIARLNKYNSSPEEAFEALSVHLFQRWLYRTRATEIDYFSVVNGAGGDGGVEAYGRSNNGDIIGLQAKFFTGSLTPGQLKNIEKSVRTAKRVRSELNEYIVCIPRKKFSDKMGRNGRVIKESEEKKVLKLAAKVEKDITGIKIIFWFEDRLLTELMEPGNEGIRRFWFDKEEISIDMLQTRFNLARTGWLNERYAPDLHVSGKVAGYIDNMLFNTSYVDQQIASITDTRNELSTALRLIDAYLLLNHHFPEINDELITIRGHVTIHLEVFDKLLGELEQQVFVPVINNPGDFEVWNTILKIKQLPNINTLRNLTPKLIDALTKIHQIYLAQYWNHINRDFHPHNYSILGPVGTGKTHALANAVDEALQAGQAALIIRAKDTMVTNWGSILRQTLDGCLAWSDQEILRGLEALAIRNSVKAAAGKQCGTAFLNRTCRVMICVDGIDEAENWGAWRDRINECQEWLIKFPLIRFVFTARSYPPQNMNPCDLPSNDLTQIRVDLPASGDTLIYDLVPEYFKAFKIEYGHNFWIRTAFENALSLKLFCELNEGSDVSHLKQDPVNFKVKYLLDIKIARLEEEFLQNYAGTFTLADQIVRSVLLWMADKFKDQIEIERRSLQKLIIEKTDGLVNQALAGKLIGLLNDHGFLQYRLEEAEDEISPKKWVYSIGIQSYSEYLVALKLAGHIAKTKLKVLPESLFGPDKQYTRTLTAVILFSNFNLLVGEHGLWTEALDQQALLRLQLQVYDQVPDAKLLPHLDTIIAKFKIGGYTHRDLIISEFVLPNLYREDLDLAKRVVHETLVSFPDTYQRDLFWTGPDEHSMEGESMLSYYLQDVSLYPFDHYLGKPLILIWSLSSIDKAYRQKCRSELTDWAYTNMEQFVQLLDLTFGCGDPQIQEDLCTIMLGLAAKFTKGEAGVSHLTNWIMTHIFAEDKINQLTDVVVRYGASAFIERMFSFGQCSPEEMKLAKPPYSATDRLLELDFTPHKLDSSQDGRFPIQDDLDWYMIKDAFTDFLAYEKGGLDAAGKKFMKPYELKYKRKINQHDFAVAAAITIIKNLGWNKNEGPARDGNSQYATFEEKYTKIAVHMIQGFLADRLPAKEQTSLLTDYRKLIHVPNPLDFGVGALYTYYTATHETWQIPEEIAEMIPVQQTADMADIKAWATRPFVPDFKRWIAVSKLGLHGINKVDDDWLTLYSSTALTDPNEVGRTRLTFNCALIPADEFEEFITFIKDDTLHNFSGNSLRPEELSSRINYGVNHSLVDVLWMDTYQEEETERWITNNLNQGFIVTPTITELHENTAGRESIHHIPSGILRKAFQIKTTDTKGFFDGNGTLKFLTHTHREDTHNEQELTLVDRATFEAFLTVERLVPVWVVEHFRSTVPNSRKKKRDDHWQNCTKWFVWGDEMAYVKYAEREHC